ncbi:MAG: DUF814 domain-containing protein [candidate division Zixibacteria bacterium]|nr:DUF814 domain-containing protein [candidate division Zixibacteria bacterium]
MVSRVVSGESHVEITDKHKSNNPFGHGSQMKIVGWHLVRLVNEASEDLVGTVVRSIRSDRESGRLFFELEARHRKRWLVVGCRGASQAFYWVSDKAVIPSLDSFVPTEKFNRLKGCRLGHVEIPQPDRVIRLSFEKPGESPDTFQRLDMWISWTGAAGNLWLVQPETAAILESHFAATDSAASGVFTPPKPPSLLNWQSITFPEFERARTENKELTLGEFLRKRFWGIDEAIARAIQSELDTSGATRNQTWTEFESCLRVLRRTVNSTTPVLIQTSSDGTSWVVPHLPATTSAEASEFRSLASALAAIDAQSGEESSRTALVALLQRDVRGRIERIRRRLNDAENAIAEGQRVPELRRRADLLGAQRHELRPGMSEITVSDWESGDPITVPLDPALTPQENIDALYDQASKATRAARNAATILPTLNRESSAWEDRLRLLDDPEIGPEELEVIKAACGIATEGKPAKRLEQKRLPYREFRLGDQVVLVGRSSRDNEQLTLKIARPHDLFLHASQSGGAHVILKRESKDREFDHKAILAAAQIAAFFSKAKHSHLVPVIYTEIRRVRKPRKAPAGLVQVTGEKSVMVRPLPPPGYHEAGYNE